MFIILQLAHSLAIGDWQSLPKPDISLLTPKVCRYVKSFEIGEMASEQDFGTVQQLICVDNAMEFKALSRILLSVV